ncbi:YraN family protein [Patescibacteria group bacterium]|nr:YraN family protein [Patescibacteria group bacterium]
MACEYLSARGFRIREKNFRRPWGEIDIVATDPKGILVFVEVKTIVRHGGDAVLLPEDNLTRQKIQKMKRIAEFYANTHLDLWEKRGSWRIDAVAIAVPDDMIPQGKLSKRELTKLINYCEISYFENVD